MRIVDLFQATIQKEKKYFASLFHNNQNLISLFNEAKKWRGKTKLIKFVFGSFEVL